MARAPQFPTGPSVGLSFKGAFAAGIMSPMMAFRSDMEKWQTGAAQLTNFFVHVQGGISNRPGTQYVGTSVQTGNPPKLIPFIFSNAQSYVLEFGAQYIRFISNGAYLTNADGSIYQLQSPYAITDVFALRYAQSADVMTITHPSYPAYNLERLAQVDWQLSEVTVGSGLDAPTMTGATATNGNAGNTGTSPGISSVVYTYNVTSVSNSPYTESQTSGSGLNVTNYNIGYYQQYGNYNTVSWDAVAGADYYNVYRQFAGQWGLVGSTTSTTFEDQDYAPDTTQGPPQAYNPIGGNYPVTVAYFQQRRVFAGSNTYPQTVWMSRNANYTNFDSHQPVVDDDGITATIASQQVNEIMHLVAMPDLLVFTGAGIWKVTGGSTGDAITPANFTATPQMYVGCSSVRPITVNSDVLFVEGKGSHVRDLQYAWETQAYQGNDLSVLADHLFYGYTISDWGFAQFPYNLLWACRSDGTLLGMTYLKEQQVWSWHQHTTSGVFLSVAVVPEQNAYGATEDVPYFVVERVIDGATVYMIERMVTRQLGASNDDASDAWFVDAGLKYSNTTTVSSVSGLTHLIGQTVSACIDGKGYIGLTVDSTGACALPVAGSEIVVGLPYTAHAQTLPLDLMQPPQFGRRKRVSKVYASLYNSLGLTVSTNGGAIQVPLGAGATTYDMTTGLAMKIPTPNWTQLGQIDFYQTYPLPCTITTLSLDVEEGN